MHGTAPGRTGPSRGGLLKPSPGPPSAHPVVGPADSGELSRLDRRHSGTSLCPSFLSRLGTLCSRFARGSCLEEAICPHASLASGGSQPPGVTSGPSGLQVGRPCLVGWALRWGLGVCSFRPWAVSLLGFRYGRTPAQNGASGGTCHLVFLP